MLKKYRNIKGYEDSLNRRIRILAPENPKRYNSKAGERFALYRNGMTVSEYIKACEEFTHGRYALIDITWDTDPKRRFIELYD